MKPLEKIYGQRFFCRRNKLSWRAGPFCQAVYDVFKPASVIDVGCAIGDLVDGFIKQGVLCYGIEGSKEAEKYLVADKELVFFKDLREPIRLPFCFDLVLCLEVAEHIEPEYAEQFVDNLIRMSDRILLSAAPPGQGGHYHVNCQPREYWERLFEGFDYYPKYEYSELLKSKLKPWRHKPGIKAYYQNLLYFEGRTRC